MSLVLVNSEKKKGKSLLCGCNILCMCWNKLNRISDVICLKYVCGCKDQLRTRGEAAGFFHLSFDY